MRPQGGSCPAPSAKHQTHQVEGRLVIRVGGAERAPACRVGRCVRSHLGPGGWRAAGGGPAVSPVWPPLPPGFPAKEVPGQLPCRAGRARPDALALSGPPGCPGCRKAQVLQPRLVPSGLSTFPVGGSLAEPTPSMSGCQQRVCVGAVPSGASLHPPPPPGLSGLLLVTP